MTDGQRPAPPAPPPPAWGPWWGWWIAIAIAAAVLAWENYPAPGAGNAKDWKFFYPAAEAIVNGTDLYRSGVGGYIYPPLLAFLMTPLVPMGWMASARVWLGLSLAALVGALVLTARHVARQIEDLGGARRPARLGAIVFVALLLSINFARRELEHAQTDWVTVLGFVLGMIWAERRPWLAGAALGLAANVKYHTLIVVPYMLIRRQYRAAGATVAFALAGALLPAVMIGWGRNLEYLRRAFGGLAQFAGIETPQRAAVWGISHLDSISVTSALSRLSESLGQGTALTLTLTMGAAGSCLALAWWMYHRVGCDFLGRASADRAPTRAGRNPGRLVNSAEWMGLMVATVAFSPQTLKRHMFLLVPVYAMTAAMLTARRRVRDPAGWTAAGVLHGKKVLLAGLFVSLLAISLPPRSEGNEALSNAWRAVGGPSWGLLVLFFALLWEALAWERAARTDGPASA